MRNPTRKRVVDVLLLGSGALLLLIGIRIHRPDKAVEFIALFFEHLGIGLFAVTLLKVFIEEAAHEQFLDILRTDVREQVGTTVISFIKRGSWILTNPELKKELENSVLLPHFARPFYNLTLKLEPLDHSKDFLKASITIEYQVKNVSEKDEAYVVGAWLEDIIRLEDPATESKPGFKTIRIGSNPLDIAVLTDRGRRPGAGKNGAIYFEGHMIQLKDLSTSLLRPGESLEITVEGMQIMRREDHFVWNLPTITHKLSFSIILAGGLTFDQLELSPREMHHMSHEEFINTSVTTKDTLTLKIDHVLLPFQGVELRWAPKPVSSATSSTPTPPPTTLPGAAAE